VAPPQARFSVMAAASFPAPARAAAVADLAPPQAATSAAAPEQAAEESSRASFASVVKPVSGAEEAAA